MHTLFLNFVCLQEILGCPMEGLWMLKIKDTNVLMSCVTFCLLLFVSFHVCHFKPQFQIH